MSNASRLAILVILVSVCAGCGKKVGGEAERPDPAAESAVPPAEFSLTSTAFVEEIKKDKPAAQAKYRGKIVEVSGEVIHVTRDVAGGTYLMLEPHGEIFQYFTRDKQPWLKYANGQKVTLRGKYDGIGGLLDCVVVEASPYPAIRISAEDLAREYSAGGEAVIKKYDERNLIVTGVIQEKTADDLHANVFLKGDSQTKIRCGALAADAELLPLKVGQRVTLIGEFSQYYCNAETAGLTSCHLVP